jgi:HEPN domain-containing protein
MKESLPQQWRDRADEGLMVARLVFGEHHFSHACFLAQQCIEKALKAFLLVRKKASLRVHHPFRFHS